MAEERRYSGITYEQIVEQLGQILKAKQGSIADFGNSSYGRTLLELFSATTDMDAFWIESAFKDSFLETAKNTGPVYANSRSLGYSLRRPSPAKAKFSIALKRTGSKPTVKVTIPKNTQFSISGVNLLAIDDVEFLYDRNEPNSENGIMQLKSGRDVLLEGVVRTQDFFSDGTKFQTFFLADKSFSDWFGPGDPNFIEPDSPSDRINRFTVISSDAGLVDGAEVTAGLEDKVFWRISRRGLHDPYLDNPTLEADAFINDVNKTTNFTVLVETANDGTVRLSFGDGIISAIPFGLINVKYISTKGEAGNLLNVAGSKLTVQSQASNISITQLNGQESDLTLDDLNIALITDIRGGLNIESIESIKKNASKIYSTLDSLGNAGSYKLFLTRMFDIKYANAFGEDLISKLKFNKFNIKYANVVRYTLLKDLYREKDGLFFITDPVEYFVSGYKVNGILYTWEYDYTELPNDSDVQKLNLDLEQLKENIDNAGLAIVQLNGAPGLSDMSYEAILENEITTEEFLQRVVPVQLNTGVVPSNIFNANLAPEDFIETGSELETINNALNRRGYLTLASNHVYVSPTVHDMAMKIDLILFEGSVFSDIKSKVIQSIYKYLKETTDFATPIYRSKIESLVQALPEVAGVNLKFLPKDNKYSSLKINSVLWFSPEAAQFIRQDPLVLNINDVNIAFEFDYNRLSNAGTILDTETDSVVTVDLTDLQTEVQARILNYYIDKLTVKNSDGTYSVRQNLTEEDVNQFTSFIWSTAMNSLYNALNVQYLTAKSNAEFFEANKLFHLIESLRGWYFSNGTVLFKDTDAIQNLHETTSSLFQFMTYNIEYIKLIRNILAPIKAGKLIDSDNNITQYSTDNEIVQFSITTSDITLRLGKS